MRIIDSKSEKYAIRGAFKTKIAGEIMNCYTRPEIEMLIILHEGHYEKYKRSSVPKPSDYCIHNLKMGKGIKQKGFITNYFSSVDDLIDVLKEYDRIRSGKQEDTIYSLLVY